MWNFSYSSSLYIVLFNTWLWSGQIKLQLNLYLIQYGSCFLLPHIDLLVIFTNQAMSQKPVYLPNLTTKLTGEWVWLDIWPLKTTTKDKGSTFFSQTKTSKCQIIKPLQSNKSSILQSKHILPIMSSHNRPRTRHLITGRLSTVIRNQP